jgi:hypothetical protein
MRDRLTFGLLPLGGLPMLAAYGPGRWALGARNYRHYDDKVVEHLRLVRFGLASFPDAADDSGGFGMPLEFPRRRCHRRRL